MSSRSYRGEPCEQCGSRRYETRDDGYTYCYNGHQQTHRGAAIAQDTGELVITGPTKKRRDSDGESIASKASGLSSPRALEQHLLCLQLVLRKQLRWLIQVQNIPEELEIIAHDLWSLRLQKLRSRISYDSETETEAHSQLFSSHSEGETSASSASRKAGRRQKVDGAPTLVDCLCLCYAALLLLREPVTVADIHSWARDGRLLYLNAAKEVPLGMRERLPATYQELLEPQSILKPVKLHQYVLDVLTALNIEYGMVIPPINHPLILYRWIRDLTLPLEIFAATQRLARILDMDYTYKLNKNPSRKDLLLRYPEVRLLALMVVTTKLHFPLDELQRYPVSANDFSALKMDWSMWTNLHRDDASRSGYQQAMEMSEPDILKASNEQLDQYMDWFEQNMASEEIRKTGKHDAEFRRALFRLFPAGLQAATNSHAARSGDSEGKVQQVASALTPRRIVRPDAPVNRTGSFYRRYRSAEELDAPDVRAFHERAALVAGLGLEETIKAVFMVESKIAKEEEKLRTE